MRRPFILGTQAKKWKATLFHRFLEVLDSKGKLLRLFTQNIDGLDFQTGIAPDKICACHGSVGQAACENCGAPIDFDEYCALVRTNIKDIYGQDASAPKQSTNIRCKKCGGNTLKPTTVLPRVRIVTVRVDPQPGADRRPRWHRFFSAPRCPRRSSKPSRTTCRART